MILRITELRLAGSYKLQLRFNDGTRKCVDVGPLLAGPVFEPLQLPAFFEKVQLDPVSGTVVWPNGADLAPESLYDLQALEESTAA